MYHLLENGSNQQSSQEPQYQSPIDNDDSEKLPQIEAPKNQIEESSVQTTFRDFLSKVFQNEDVRSLADGRLAIEEEFEHNLMPDRELLDYILYRQDSNKTSQFTFGVNKKRFASKDVNEEQVKKEGQNVMEVESQTKSSSFNTINQPEVGLQEENEPSSLSEETITETQVPYALNTKSQQNTMNSQMEETKEPVEEPKKKLFLDKCKLAGRLGPAITKFDQGSENSSDFKFFGHEGLQIECITQFSSIRANTAVFSGSYFYEVKLETAGLMQIGWCTFATPFYMENGVGDDKTSYAYDGQRVMKWNDQKNSIYGEGWSVGDTIGTLIDFNKRTITYWRNEKCLGIAFKDIKIGANMAYFPAISMQNGERVTFNFGKKPFRIRTNYQSCAINEPECQVNNYYSTAMFIMETIKRYVVIYYDFPHLGQDERLMVGSVLFEYLIPLMSDKYIMEDLIVQFFFELQMINRHEFFDLIIKTMEVHFSNEQIIEWTQTFMSLLCNKISTIQIQKGDKERETNKEFEMHYIKALITLIKKDFFMYAWLCSDNFFDDLEQLYLLHLPSHTDWNMLIPHFYHELIPGTSQFKDLYFKGQQNILNNLKITQKYWFEVTDLLMDGRKRYLPDELTPKVPRELFQDFLQYLVCKNSGYLKNVKPPGLTSVGTLANIFFCAIRHLDESVFSKPIDQFPIQCFFKRDDGILLDDNIRNLDRVGGTFSHLENELQQQLKGFKNPKQLSQEEKTLFLMTKNLILIFSFGVIQEISSYVKCLEKIYVNSRFVEDLTSQGLESQGKDYIKEMKDSAKKLPQYQLIFQSEANRVQIHKFAMWLMRLMNHIDEKYQNVIYIMPELFAEIPFDVFRAFKRGGTVLYETEQEQSVTHKTEYEQVYNTPELKKTSFAFELVKYISKHFFDLKIANPDQKEIYLTRLNILLQYDQYIKMFEKYEFSKENLIPSLMNSFERKNIFPVTKNFLRFAKGKGFKEIAYKNLVENTYSEFFLNQLRKQLSLSKDKLSKDFMNQLFNNLNEITTELFVFFKELKKNYSFNVAKKTKTYFQTVIDLNRLLEVLTKYVPEIFVDKEQIQSTRLINYIMFVLQSLFQGSIDGYIEFFAQKTQQKSDMLPQFLAPMLSILKNLYIAVNTLGNKDNLKYDNLPDIFAKTDSFDPVLFEKVRSIIKNELPANNEDERDVLNLFDQMIDEIEMLCQSNKIRKHSLESDGGNNDNQQVNQDERCPFCNSVILDTKKTQ